MVAELEDTERASNTEKQRNWRPQSLPCHADDISGHVCKATIQLDRKIVSSPCLRARV